MAKIKQIICISLLLLTFSANAQNLRLGAERLDAYLPLIENKKVGVVGNQTSMIGNTHLVDSLLSIGIDVVKVFSPEHGFRGKADAGAKVENGTDSKTGLPIISLYGKNKKPYPEQLEGIDVMLFDIQDVGARFYTYISTLHYIMEAAAENNIKVIILDRPNPNSHYVDGPIREKGFESFIGMHPVPVLYGLTIGEYGLMINGQGWLAGGVQTDLTVISCAGYNRTMDYELPIAPSPNLPNQKSINLYPSLCFFEGTSISVGRGTNHPFEVFGHPNMTTGSHVFVPKPNDGSKHPKHEGLPCIGWDLTEFGGKNVQEKRRLILDYMVNAYREFPDKESFFLSNGFINKLAGTDELQKQIEAGMSADEIRATWRSDLATYLNMRGQYLLYPDFQ